MQKQPKTKATTKARLRRKIELLDRQIKKMERWDHNKRKKQEDRRRFLAGCHFYPFLLKNGGEEKAAKLMDGWLIADRDRDVWGLSIIEKKDFRHNPEKIENRKKYHIGSYFIEQYRQENRMEELRNLIGYLLKNPLDKRLFSVESP